MKWCGGLGLVVLLPKFIVPEVEQRLRSSSLDGSA